jgi:hypothetical protein
MWFLYLVPIICLLGTYKGYKAWIACIKASAFEASFNMLLITILFLSLLVITIYVVKNYNITEKFNLETYEQQRINETGMYYNE